MLSHFNQKQKTKTKFAIMPLILIPKTNLIMK